MFFFSWLRNQKVSGRGARRAGPGRSIKRSQPRVETLEDRAVPAMLTVTTPLDVIDPNDGLLSLREAIIRSNATPGQETIALPAGTYRLTLAGAYEDAAATGDLDITDHVTITGAGAGATIIDGNGLDRVFQVRGTKQVALSGVAIQGGVADQGGGILAPGGSILTIDHCTISGNTGGEGGGINAQQAVVNVDQCILSGNSASFGGGIITGYSTTLTINHSTLCDNTAGEGGGVYAFATVVNVEQSTLSGNMTVYGGGGIWAVGGTLIIDHSTLSCNLVSGNYNGGGGIFAEFGTTLIIDHSTLSGNTANRGGGIYANFATLTAHQSTISGNTAIDGGGIYAFGATLTIDQSTISGNAAVYGGGLLATYGSTAEIDQSTLNDFVGGGIWNDFSTIHLKQTEVDGMFYKNQDYP